MPAVIPIAALADGEMTLCRVGATEVLVCHVQGQYYAVESRCSHAGQPLIGGRLDGFKLRCPLHRASFDIRTGQPLGAPASEPIRTFPVTLGGGKVTVDV